MLAADGFSYNLVEASYVSTEVDGLDVDGDGFGIGGSVAFAPNVFGFAGLTDIDYDAGISATNFNAGLGFNWALNPALDLVSGVSFERVKVKVSGFGSDSDSGYGLNVGLRGRVGEALELTGGVKYVDLGSDLDDTTLSVGARYYFTPAFAAGIDVSDNDDGTTWGLAVRYDFGSRQ